MHKIIVITGTPGTGKTTLAKNLGRSMEGATVINVNSIVKSEKLFTGYDEYGTMIADMDALEKRISIMIKHTKGIVIIEGHLLCDIKVSGAIAIVLRCHLKDLEKRLKKRGYSSSKLRDNIIAEALDYCGTMASSNYVHMYEIMGGKQQMLKNAMHIINNKGENRAIELSEELLDIIKNRGVTA